MIEVGDLVGKFDGASVCNVEETVGEFDGNMVGC